MPHRPSILFVEDDPDDQYFILKAFGSLGKSEGVRFFTNGIAVLEYLLEHTLSDPPALIVLDYNMPLLNGIEVLRHIREMKRYRDTPVVMFSTSVTERMREESRNLGAIACVQKATSYDKLLDQVHYFDELVRDDVDTLLGL